MLHILLVIGTSAQVMVLCENTFSRSRAETRYIYYWFMSNKSSLYSTGEDYVKYIQIFDVDQLNSTLRGHINARSFPSYSLELLQRRRGVDRPFQLRDE